MKYTSIIILVFLLNSCAGHDKSQLLGVWKSDEKKTLSTIESVDEIPIKTRKLLENDFFGHLIVEYKENEARSYFDNCGEMYENSKCKKDNMSYCEKSKEFGPYRLIEETSEYFIIGYHDDILNEDVEKTLYREGNCYYMYFSEKWDIKEYFCKQ